MTKKQQVYIAVIGGAVCSPEVAALAEEVGELLALKGIVLVCGGRTGVTEAACRGAKKAGGTTLGILPGRSRAEANPYVDFAVATGLGEMRNSAIIMTADGAIALPGAFGTLSEISFAMMYEKPVVSLGSWDVTDRIPRAETPKDAVERILREVKT